MLIAATGTAIRNDRDVVLAPDAPTSTAHLHAVLFDFGDTLVRFGPINRHQLFERGARRTYRMWAARQQRMPDWRRYYLHQWFAFHWYGVKTLLLRRELDALRVIRRACQKLWLADSAEFFDELMWNWYRPLVDVSQVEPGTHDVLQQLQSAGYKLGIISNTFVPGFVLDRHLEQLGLLHYFPTRIYSCDVGWRKPDRRIFQHTLDRMNVPADRALYIGDLLHVDIEGARRAGLHAALRVNTPGESPSPQLPADVASLTSIHQLPALLDTFNFPRRLRLSTSGTTSGDTSGDGGV